MTHVMKRIFLAVLMSLFLPTTAYCDFPSTLGVVRINEAEITEFIKSSEAFYDRPLNKSHLDALLAQGKKVFIKGSNLPEKFLNTFQSQASSSQGEGAEQIYFYDFLNMAIDENQKIWDHYVVLVTLQFDQSGKVVDFYWDKPMRVADKDIDAEQLGIFLRYVQQKDFHGMKNKGYELFQKGRVLSPEYRELFKEFLKEAKDTTAHFVFYSVVSGTRVANIELDVNVEDGSVLNFSGIESW
jgi:hypothetical protein